MNELAKRFDREVENRAFTLFEIKGFMVDPKLALKAGMAIGYKMALEDCSAQPSVQGGRANLCQHCQSLVDRKTCFRCGAKL